MQILIADDNGTVIDSVKMNIRETAAFIQILNIDSSIDETLKNKNAACDALEVILLACNHLISRD